MLRIHFALPILAILGYHEANAYGGKPEISGYHHYPEIKNIHCHRGIIPGNPLKIQIYKEDSDDCRERLGRLKYADNKLELAQLSGQVHVSDGDTIKFGKTRVRLFGIDAPEINQTCNILGKYWDCGIEARLALVRIIGAHSVSCVEKDRDRYGRVVAVCVAGGINLNAKLVSEGWALAYRKYSSEYEKEELKARASKLGLWKGSFAPPWDWRKSQRP